MVMPRYRLIVAFGFAAAALVVAAPAHAQSANVLDQIVAQFQARSAGWEGTLRGLATETFGILAGVELAWAAFRLAFRGADVSEWLAEIVNQILFLGFFLALLENSVTWGQAIVSSFRQAASAAGGGGIAPSDVFAAGAKIAAMVLNQMTIWHPEASAGLMVAGIVIEVCFALMAAFMVLALVESYLIISMGVLFMAFLLPYKWETVTSESTSPQSFKEMKKFRTSSRTVSRSTPNSRLISSEMRSVGTPWLRSDKIRMPIGLRRNIFPFSTLRTTLPSGVSTVRNRFLIGGI